MDQLQKTIANLDTLTETNTSNIYEMKKYVFGLQHYFFGGENLGKKENSPDRKQGMFERLTDEINQAFIEVSLAWAQLNEILKLLGMEIEEDVTEKFETMNPEEHQTTLIQQRAFYNSTILNKIFYKLIAVHTKIYGHAPLHQETNREVKVIEPVEPSMCGILENMLDQQTVMQDQIVDCCSIIRQLYPVCEYFEGQMSIKTDIKEQPTPMKLPGEIPQKPAKPLTV
jgi:hypothetical protein